MRSDRATGQMFLGADRLLQSAQSSIGSLKKLGGRKSKGNANCQCKHHQQKLLEKAQMEDRGELATHQAFLEARKRATFRRGKQPDHSTATNWIGNLLDSKTEINNRGMN